MPIEIRELVIKLVVENDSLGKSSGTGRNNSANGTSPSEELVNICVGKVFEMLKEKNSR